MSSEIQYRNKNWFSKKQSRWLLHLIFWLAVLVFYTLFFGYKSVSYKITFSFVIVLLPVTIITTYFLNYELLPNYLFKGRYVRFFLYFLYTLIVSFFIEMLTVIGIYIMVAELNMEEMHPSNTNAIFLIAGMYVVVFLGVAIKLVNHYQKHQLQIESLQREKVESELELLKAQLHPHFLFNTLNNIYALTLEDSVNASKAVLRLSEMLEYMLYDGKGDLVPLDKEIRLMHNYIDLEKLRYGDRLNVKMDVEEEQHDVQIPPLLLITLLENCFKHGVSKSIEAAKIDIKLHSNEDTFQFFIENSVPAGKESSSNGVGGIGLKNVEERLIRLYQDNFSLKVSKNERTFSVDLVLNHVKQQ